MLEILVHVVLVAFAPPPPLIETSLDIVAAWNADDVRISTDGGATFTQIVHSPGDVCDVEFDVYGRIVVLVATLPDNRTQLLGDGPAGPYVLTTAFDPHPVP